MYVLNIVSDHANIDLHLGYKIEAQKDRQTPAQLPPELELNKEFTINRLSTKKGEEMDYSRIQTAPVWKTYVRDAGERLTTSFEQNQLGSRTGRQGSHELVDEQHG